MGGACGILAIYWEKRDARRILVEKPEDEKQLGRPRCVFGG